MTGFEEIFFHVINPVRGGGGEVGNCRSLQSVRLSFLFKWTMLVDLIVISTVIIEQENDRYCECSALNFVNLN